VKALVRDDRFLGRNLTVTLLTLEARRRLTPEVELRAADSTGAAMVIARYLMLARNRMVRALGSSNVR
jgi:hypothetical protein